MQKYLMAFVSHEFETCDEMVTSSRDKLLTEEHLLLGSNSASVDIYQSLLNGVADCIKKVQVVNQTNGVTTIQVSLLPYPKTESIELDTEHINTVMQQYIDGDITTKEMKKEITSLYIDSFEKTVLRRDESQSVITYEYDLIEKNSDKVEGIFDFVYDLLEKSNLLYNLDRFEESIESTFSTTLERLESANNVSED